MTDCFTRLTALAARLLGATGVAEPDRLATAILALGDGFALQRIAGVAAPADDLERAVLAIVTAGRMDDTTRAQWVDDA